MGKPDRSNGYDALAAEFMARRARAPIGAATVGEWAKRLARGAKVLDVGCGNGIPIAQVLIDGGMTVHGVDASPAMIADFKRRFPDAEAEICAVEDFEFPYHAYDGVTSWGLMFLLAPDVQIRLIHNLYGTLKPGGRLLFTAPGQAGEWVDVLTQRISVSLGRSRYIEILRDAGFDLEGETDDDHGNHYYLAVRPPST